MARGTHYGESKGDLQSRLRKMEGQVCGLQQTVDAGRYGLDVVQQVNAVTAGLREVSLIVVESHVTQAASTWSRSAVTQRRIPVRTPCEPTPITSSRPSVKAKPGLPSRTRRAKLPAGVPCSPRRATA